MIRQDHKSRQVIVQTPQTVTHPTAHAGKSGQLKTGGLQVSPLTMDPRFPDHVMNERDVVHHRSQGGDDLAQKFAGLTIRPKLPERLHPGTQAVLKCLHVFPKIAFLPMAPDQLRFEIEQVQMAGSAGHEHLDHALRFRLIMRKGGPGSIPGVRRPERIRPT